MIPENLHLYFFFKQKMEGRVFDVWMTFLKKMSLAFWSCFLTCYCFLWGEHNKFSDAFVNLDSVGMATQCFHCSFWDSPW